MARAGSGITSVKDLAGKKVNLGPQGSGTRANALEVLANAGLGPRQLIASDLAPAPAAAKLTAGEIDALLRWPEPAGEHGRCHRLDGHPSRRSGREGGADGPPAVRAEGRDSAILSHIDVRTAREGVTISWCPAAETLLKPAP